MNGTNDQKVVSGMESAHPKNPFNASDKEEQKKRKRDAPIPKPSTDLGFHGIRHKPAHLESRWRVRRGN